MTPINVITPALFRVQAQECNNQSQAKAKPFYSSNTSIRDVTSQPVARTTEGGRVCFAPHVVPAQP